MMSDIQKRVDPGIHPGLDSADVQLLHAVHCDIPQGAGHARQPRQTALQLSPLPLRHVGQGELDVLQDVVTQGVHIFGAAIGVVQGDNESRPRLFGVARLETTLLDRRLQHVVGQVEVAGGVALTQTRPQHTAEVALEDAAGVVYYGAYAIEGAGRYGSP